MIERGRQGDARGCDGARRGVAAETEADVLLGSVLIL